ncbi:MAG: hypothetical protein QOE57_1193 [Acidimicrobiaceae bacterium]|nr:hypothetical protein [Acidimicrobiaceae bacterium]
MGRAELLDRVKLPEPWSAGVVGRGGRPGRSAGAVGRGGPPEPWSAGVVAMGVAARALSSASRATLSAWASRHQAAPAIWRVVAFTRLKRLVVAIQRTKPASCDSS